MTCNRCDDGIVVRCVDDICRGIGRCCLGGLDCDGLAPCPVCHGDPESIADEVDDDDEPEPEVTR